jgi:hypothetical protein
VFFNLEHHFPPKKKQLVMNGLDPGQAVYAQDEYGRPFIIVRDQQKTRIKGLEAQKVFQEI